MKKASEPEGLLGQFHSMYAKEVERREEEGDPMARIHRLNLSLPWSLEALGPEITDIKLLAEIEKGLLDGGALQNYYEGRIALRWTHGRRAVIEVFLSALALGNGSRWADFAEAYRPVYDQVAAAKSIPREELPESPYPTVRDKLNELALPTWVSGGQDKDCLSERSWDRSLPELARGLRVAQTVVEAACVEGWRDAFATGRLLLARKSGDRWTFCPPHQFENKPPFPCLAIEDIEARFQDEDAEIARVAGEQRARRLREGRGTLQDHFAVSLPELPKLTVAGFSGSKNCSDLKGAATAVHDVAVVFSHQLEEILHGLGQSSTLTPAKLGRPAEPADIPIVNDLLRRMRASEFDTVGEAVSWRRRNREDWFDKHPSCTPEAEQRRLKRSLERALRSEPDKSGQK